MSVKQTAPVSDLVCLVDFGGPKKLHVMVNKTMTFGMLRQLIINKLHGTTSQIKDVRITYNGSQLNDNTTLEKEGMYTEGVDCETVQGEIVNYTTGMC